MEMVLNLPLSRRNVRGPYSDLWDVMFTEENIEAERIFKLTPADFKGRSLKAMANTVQSAGRVRKCKVITRRNGDALFCQVKRDAAAHYSEEP